MNTYTQITYEQRCQIYALKDTGCRQQSMAYDIDWLNERHDWSGLRGIIAVTSKRETAIGHAKGIVPPISLLSGISHSI